MYMYIKLTKPENFTSYWVLSHLELRTHFSHTYNLLKWEPCFQRFNFMNPGVDDLNHFSDVLFFLLYFSKCILQVVIIITVYFYLGYHFFVILFPKFLRRKAGHYLLQEKANLHRTRWMIIQKRSSEQWLKKISQ